MIALYTVVAMAVFTVIAIQAVKQIRLFLIKLYEHTQGEKFEASPDDETDSNGMWI